ncbi:hypothetical protein GWK53_39935 [Burkholderia cepacia]|nr:hypothetical protein [Burkholderia cepacia]
MLEVSSPERIDAVHWYGVECVRVGTSLQVVVTRFNDDGSGTVTSRTAYGAKPIKIKMASASVPLSVGGKLGADGSVLIDTDQFNGVVDNVFVQVG